MAVLGKAHLLGSTTHITRVPRNQTAAIFGLPAISHSNALTPTTRGGGYGVVGDDDFKVTATTGLGWSCAPGRIVATGTSALAQGCYTGMNDAAQTGTLNARDATNPRITLIAYRVRDTDEDATTFEDDAIVMIDGTPNASPADPSVPSSLGSLVILSRVNVPSSANGGAPTFTDFRRFAATIGGVQRVTSATRPTGAALYKGLPIIEVDTGSRLWWDGTTWRYAYKPWTAYTPSTNTILSIGNGTYLNYFTITNNVCHIRGELILGTTTNFGASAFTFQLALPTGFSTPGSPMFVTDSGAAQFIQGSTARWFPAVCQVNATAQIIEVINVGGPQSQNYQLNFGASQPFAWTSTDVIRWSVSYPLA